MNLLKPIGTEIPIFSIKSLDCLKKSINQKFQVEKWRIVSWPNEGDYLMMLWCGNLPILEYNGGIFLSRHRSDKDMPESTLEEFKKMSKKHGIPWSDWCPSNNEHCTKYPEDHN